MAVTNRAAKLAKLHRVAKKNYQPVVPPGDRTVLEHLLYACVLENSMFDAADVAFARLQEGYFDWNEVRVTTAVELAEVLNCLTDPNEAAVRLKKTLHSMFETHYSFDIDTLRKENLGKAVQKIQGYNGSTPFVVSYVAQNGLGGHSIAVDRSLINLLYTIGAIDEKEASRGQVPGIERAITKTKGVEFFSVVHQLAVAYSSSPFNNDVRNILLSIDLDAKERFPKRQRKKKVEDKPAKQEKARAANPDKAKSSSSGAEDKKARVGKTTKVAAKSAAKKATAKRSAKTSKAKAVKKVTKKSKSATTRKKAATKKTATKKTSKKASKKKTAKKKVAKKKVTKKKTTKAASKKKSSSKASRKKGASKATRRLARKKPR